MERRSASCFGSYNSITDASNRNIGRKQEWKPKLKPKPENSVLKEIFKTETVTETC